MLAWIRIVNVAPRRQVRVADGSRTFLDRLHKHLRLIFILCRTGLQCTRSPPSAHILAVRGFESSKMALKLSTRPLPRLETLLRVHSRLVPSPLQPVRHASSKPITNKSRILEKPDRFRPPSHGKRLPRARRTFGPALSEAEVHAQATKKYPNMMPAKGTFMHWLLTNRPLHLWISLVRLPAPSSVLPVRTLTREIRARLHHLPSTLS